MLGNGSRVSSASNVRHEASEGRERRSARDLRRKVLQVLDFTCLFYNVRLGVFKLACVYSFFLFHKDFKINSSRDLVSSSQTFVFIRLRRSSAVVCFIIQPSGSPSIIWEVQWWINYKHRAHLNNINCVFQPCTEIRIRRIQMWFLSLAPAQWVCTLWATGVSAVLLSIQLNVW